jgi:methyl-accepting chemotaxis protein
VTVRGRDSENAAKTAEYVRAKAEEALSSLNEMRNEMRAVVEIIRGLNEQIQAARDVIVGVDNLPRQSSLPPPVDSAKAAKHGDNGGRLGVVAREIHSLAEKSNHALAQVRVVLSGSQKSNRTRLLAAASNVKEEAKRLQGLAMELQRLIDPRAGK